MFKYLSYGISIIGLLFAAGMTQANESEIKLCGSTGVQACDISFTAIPTFEPPPICVSDIKTFQYTITNNTPVPLGLNYIRIKNNDGLPDAEVTIVTAPTNNCGASLAEGASCNILVSVQPLAFGNINRVLQIGVNSLQVELDSPIVFSVNCETPTLETVVFGPGPGQSVELNCSVLGATTVTNTNTPTIVNGNVCVSPGTAITGFPPGIITNGFQQPHTSIAMTAQANNTTVLDPFLDGLTCTSNLTGQDLGGKNLTPGVYCFDISAQLTGTLTLNGPGFYYFKVGTTLTTASASSVVLINGAASAQVFWDVGSAATLGTGTTFKGVITAGTSITLNTGVVLAGRALAETGAVSLDLTHVNPLAP